jgi:hypothetical protein
MGRSMTKTNFIDGSTNHPGCACGADCAYPCWQRYGLAPACDDCDCAEFAHHATADPNDRADALRSMPDLWPVIRENLGTHQFDEIELEAKFRKGEAEHGRDWLNMTRAQIEREILAEWLDLCLYTAMIRARFGTE